MRRVWSKVVLSLCDGCDWRNKESKEVQTGRKEAQDALVELNHKLGPRIFRRRSLRAVQGPLPLLRHSHTRAI